MGEYFYFTFGVNTNLANKYVKILAGSMGEARSTMQKHHGMQWAFAYTDKEFMPQIARFNLTEVPLGTEVTKNY